VRSKPSPGLIRRSDGTCLLDVITVSFAFFAVQFTLHGNTAIRGFTLSVNSARSAYFCHSALTSQLLLIPVIIHKAVSNASEVRWNVYFIANFPESVKVKEKIKNWLIFDKVMTKIVEYFLTDGVVMHFVGYGLYVLICRLLGLFQ